MTGLYFTSPLVTSSDIAVLAGVRRPVVSTWRARFAGGDCPFPAVAESHGGRDAFRLDHVVAWLEETGHGNNPQVRQDAATAVALDVLPMAERRVAVDGLLALLTLKAQLGSSLSGLSAEDLLDLADDADPHDRAVHREIAALGTDATRWAEHADSLASAAFTPAGAMASLLARRRRLGLEAVTDHALAPAALDLVARLANHLTSPDSVARPFFVAPFGDADLLEAVARQRGEAATAAVPVRDSPAARHARRVLLTGGWALIDAAEDDGGVLPPAGATVLAHLPCATRSGLTDAEVLDALGEMEATLPSDALAIVVGPATALCGRLPGGMQASRATVLRSGRVRAIVQLPRGLRPARSRQVLGLWILGPKPVGARTDVHRTAVADLRATALDAATIDDVVTDIVSVVDPGLDPRAHAFRFARLAQTTDLIATSGDLVGAHPTTGRKRHEPAALAYAVNDLYAQATTPLPPLTLGRALADKEGSPSTLTLRQLIDLGHLRLIASNQIAKADLSDEAGVRVHTPATLTGTRTGPGATIDRIQFATAYPRGRYTEPGDIVFCTAPRPAAVIDTEGVAVVAAPARVLRLSSTAPTGLVPEVVAHAIGSASPLGDWRLIPVPLIPPGQVDAVRRALASLEDVRAAAAARLGTLDTLTGHLVEAVASGVVSLHLQHSAPQEG